jgi:hypothetical protein
MFTGAALIGLREETMVDEKAEEIAVRTRAGTGRPRRG